MEKFPSGSKVEKVTRLSRLVSVGALAASAFLACVGEREEKENKTGDQKVEQIEDIQVREARLLKKYKIDYVAELDSAVPQSEWPYTDMEAGLGIDKLVELKMLAEKRELNFIVDGKTEEEIAALYKEVVEGIDQSIAARRKLVELAYHLKDDPRIRVYLDDVVDILGVDDQHKEAILAKPLEVQVMEAAVEAMPGQLGFVDEDGISISAVQLVRAIDLAHPEHYSGVSTVANELCHYVRREQYGGGEAYHDQYNAVAQNNKLPTGYVSIDSLPFSAKQLYEKWMSDHYTRSEKSGYYLREAESFAVAFKILERSCGASPIKLAINPEDVDIKTVIDELLKK